jgi:hypothetical protein
MLCCDFLDQGLHNCSVLQVDNLRGRSVHVLLDGFDQCYGVNLGDLLGIVLDLDNLSKLVGDKLVGFQFLKFVALDGSD